MRLAIPKQYSVVACSAELTINSIYEEILQQTVDFLQIHAPCSGILECLAVVAVISIIKVQTSLCEFATCQLASRRCVDPTYCSEPIQQKAVTLK